MVASMPGIVSLLMVYCEYEPPCKFTQGLGSVIQCVATKGLLGGCICVCVCDVKTTGDIHGVWHWGVGSLTTNKVQNKRKEHNILVV